MSDAHRGRITYMSGHEDDRAVSVMFEADVMVDPGLCIVHVYNLIHIEVIDRYMSVGPPSNWLRCGTKQVRRAAFLNFFGRSDPLQCFMSFFVHQFFGVGWRFGLGFDTRHCDNVRNRQLTSAVRGGLDSRLPVCVLNRITDTLTDWAVPVAVAEAMAVSKVYAVWNASFLAPAGECLWHGIMSTEFRRFLDRAEKHDTNKDQVKKN